MINPNVLSNRIVELSKERLRISGAEVVYSESHSPSYSFDQSHSIDRGIRVVLETRKCWGIKAFLQFDIRNTRKHDIEYEWNLSPFAGEQLHTKNFNHVKKRDLYLTIVSGDIPNPPEFPAIETFESNSLRDIRRVRKLYKRDVEVLREAMKEYHSKLRNLDGITFWGSFLTRFNELGRSSRSQYEQRRQYIFLRTLFDRIFEAKQNRLSLTHPDDDRNWGIYGRYNYDIPYFELDIPKFNVEESFNKKIEKTIQLLRL